MTDSFWTQKQPARLLYGQLVRGLDSLTLQQSISTSNITSAVLKAQEFIQLQEQQGKICMDGVCLLPEEIPQRLKGKPISTLERWGKALQSRYPDSPYLPFLGITSEAMQNPCNCSNGVCE